MHPTADLTRGFAIGDVIPIRFQNCNLEPCSGQIIEADEHTLTVRYCDGLFQGLRGLIRLPRRT